jgi:hypothetical protein
MMMSRILALCLCTLLASAAPALAGEAGRDGRVSAAQLAGEGEQTAKAESMSEEDRKAEEMSEDEQTTAARKTDEDKESEAKEMSGMSIVGNDEAPKSLYIVPWKSSEIGGETSLDTMLSESDVPVDRDVFRRQIEFYQVRTDR